MSDDVLLAAAAAGLRGAQAALATVLTTAGSTPRHAGARMLITADGIVGTIGGGRVEHEVIARARQVAAGAAPAQRFERHLVHDLAMCCGGKMEVWIEPLDAGRAIAMGEAARRRARRRPCALVTVLDERGAKDVRADDPVLASRRPRVEGWAGTTRLVEPILPAERLVLFGAGHVARALAPLAAGVGFELVVCDDDDGYASEARFPGARLIPTFDAREAARELAPFGAGDYAIILTRDHAVDQAILEELLPRAELTYLGLIGSRGKLGRFRRRLDAKGIGDEAAWKRLHCPVGLDLGAETPAEIAVAIVAELIAARHRVGA